MEMIEFTYLGENYIYNPSSGDLHYDGIIYKPSFPDHFKQLSSSKYLGIYIGPDGNPYYLFSDVPRYAPLYKRIIDLDLVDLDIRNIYSIING